MKTFINRNILLVVLIFIHSLTACTQDLVDKKVLANKLSIQIPKDFVLMSEDMLNVKYPATSRRPTEVYTNEAGSINIALNYTQNQITLEDLPEMEKVLKNQFISTAGITFSSSEIKSINGQKFVIFDFYSKTVDAKIYNLMFVTSLNNRMLIGTFNCTEEHFSHWKLIGQKIINSLRVL